MMQANETIQRLRWQCRRGLLELDYILLNYLEKQFPSAAAAEQQQFIELLQQQDTVLQTWLLDGQKPEPEFALIINHLRATI